MTPVSHEQSLAAEDEGGGYLETNDRKRESPAVKDEDPEETEDEEVKKNCIGGYAGVQDSDLSSDEDSEEDDDDDEEPDEDGADVKGESKGRPVQFVSSQQSAGDIRRPRAILANSPTSRSPQNAEEQDDEDDDSSMDESSVDGTSSDEEVQGIGMSIEVAKLYESEDEESLSDASSRFNDEQSTGGIAGSADESDEEEEQDEDLEEEDDEDVPAEENVQASESEDEEMSDDDSEVSVPLDTFKNCDGPSDVLELESALQDSKHENSDDESVASDDSAMEDLRDPTLQSALLSDIVELEPKQSNPNALAHVKRVLSSSALLGRSNSSSALSPKRVCRFAGGENSSDDDALPPELSLGQAAFSTSQKVSVSDEDEEEQDRQLGEELQEGEEERERETTPIPLLTPPSSPLRVESDEGDVTVCEWPSNLAVDSAMTATMGLRPPSPQNLQTWEQQEEERLMKSTDSTPKAAQDEGAFSSSLTPMMRGISVDSEAPFLCL